MLFFLIKSFPRDVVSFVIPMFKFLDDEAIWKIFETLDANYLRVSIIISWSNVATVGTVEIYKKSIQHT